MRRAPLSRAPAPGGAPREASGPSPGLALAATAALALAWAAPLERWTGAAFPAHMLAHMTLVAVAAPALVLAWPGAFRRLQVPVLAGAVIEFAIVWGWHLPALHGAARLDAGWFLAEQLLFLLGGLAVWAGALLAPHPLAGAGALLLTSIHMTMLGALLVLARTDLYGAICGTPPDVPAQQVGGLMMLGIGTPIYLLGGLWLAARALRDPGDEPGGGPGLGPGLGPGGGPRDAREAT